LKPLEKAVRRRGGTLLAVGTAGSLVLLAAAAGPASAAGHARSATHPPAAKVAVPQGVAAAALKGAGVFGPTPPGTPERVSFILKARHLGALEADVAGGTPGGQLSPRQFAARFGQTPAHIAALRAYLSHFGIKTTSYRDGLDVRATGTAGKFDKALSVQQKNFRIPAVKAAHGRAGRPAMTIHGTKDQALLPGALARSVLAILGLTNYPTASSNLVREPALGKHVKPAAVQTGALTPEDFAKQYNLTPLYRRGLTGKGETIGIVTLATLRPSDATTFWHKVLHLKTRRNKIKLVNVDGGSGPFSAESGSDETDLDVEQSGALAPGAKVIVYQAPNTDPGFADAFYQEASQNAADTVSTSWGEAEDVIRAGIQTGAEPTAYEQVFNQVFLEFGAQRQSSFVAQGDVGAFDDSDELGTTELNVDNPGDSPWTTSAGGTTLPGTIPLSATDSAKITQQRAWGWDWLWPHFSTFGAPTESGFAFANPLGGGGGYSMDQPRPAYQRQVPGLSNWHAEQYLTPTSPQTVGNEQLPTAWILNEPPIAQTGRTAGGRALPDVSTDADPFTGFELYFTGEPGDPLGFGAGGTSFVAPQLNGSTAVIDQAVGHRVGFWNTSIYRWAMQPGSPFHPLSSASPDNDNLFYTGSPGRIWNPATGLGTPNLAKLAGDFARG
jgi:subtilase family serine protease